MRGIKNFVKGVHSPVALPLLLSGSQLHRERKHRRNIKLTGAKLITTLPSLSLLIIFNHFKRLRDQGGQLL